MEKIQYELKLEEYNKVASVTIYPTVQEAIDRGWEESYFINNTKPFVDIKIDDFVIRLITNGDVLVVCDDNLLTNEDIEKIRELVDNESIEDDDKHYIDDNHSFSIMSGIDNGEPDGEVEYTNVNVAVYEAQPDSIEAFKQDLVGLTKYLYKEYVLNFYEMG